MHLSVQAHVEARHRHWDVLSSFSILVSEVTNVLLWLDCWPPCLCTAILGLHGARDPSEPSRLCSEDLRTEHLPAETFEDIILCTMTYSGEQSTLMKTKH